jgi:hypothetical protein
MLLSAACSRIQEASRGTRPLHSSGAGAPTILSPHGGHGAASGRVDAGDPPGTARPVSAGRTAGPATVPPTVARWSWWGTTRLPRRDPPAAGAPAHAVALVLSGTPRLALRLASVGAGVRTPAGAGWPPAGAQQGAAIQAVTGGWGANECDAVGVASIRRAVDGADARPRPASSTARRSSPGAAPIPMRPPAAHPRTRAPAHPRTIPARSCVAIGCIPCSVGAPACRCCFASLPRMSTMRPSPARYLNWPFACSPCGLGWCASMRAIGASR